MRLSVSKAQHRSLLIELAEQLGSDRPIDALEHVLNCWMVGNIPQSATTTTPIAPTPEPEDDFSALMEF